MGRRLRGSSGNAIHIALPSTSAKVIALTYDKLAALAQALEIDFDELFGRRAPTASMTATLTRSGEQGIYDTPNYQYGMLANDLTGKRMVPMRAHICAQGRGLRRFRSPFRRGVCVGSSGKTAAAV